MKTILAAAALLAGTAAPALAAPIIYTGVQQVGASTATLSIVTNGTLGTLTAANILSVSATLTNGTGTVTLLRDIQNSTGNASTTLTAALRATSTSLILPYLPGASNNEFAIYGPGFTNWYAAGQGSVISSTSQQSIKIGADVAGTPLQQDLVLATAQAPGAVPEPATWGMMLVGFGMIGFGMRRRVTVRTAVRFA